MNRPDEPFFRERGPIQRLLFWEVVPDPGGLVSFGILALAVTIHLFALPDAGGYTGRYLREAPAFRQAPLLQAALEGLVESALVLGPAVALYGGLRHLFRRSEHLLPYFTVAGGGFLSLLTACALASL